MRWRTEQPAGQTDRHNVHFLRLASSFARQLFTAPTLTRQHSGCYYDTDVEIKSLQILSVHANWMKSETARAASIMQKCYGPAIRQLCCTTIK